MVLHTLLRPSLPTTSHISRIHSHWVALAVGAGWFAFLSLSNQSPAIVFRCSRHPFRCFGIRHTNLHRTCTPRYLLYGATPSLTILTIFYIPYRPSPDPQYLASLVSFDFELCKMWMLPLFTLYQCHLSFVHLLFVLCTAFCAECTFSPVPRSFLWSPSHSLVSLITQSASLRTFHPHSDHPHSCFPHLWLQIRDGTLPGDCSILFLSLSFYHSSIFVLLS